MKPKKRQDSGNNRDAVPGRNHFQTSLSEKYGLPSSSGDEDENHSFDNICDNSQVKQPKRPSERDDMGDRFADTLLEQSHLVDGSANNAEYSPRRAKNSNFDLVDGGENVYADAEDIHQTNNGKFLGEAFEGGRAKFKQFITLVSPENNALFLSARIRLLRFTTCIKF